VMTLTEIGVTERVSRKVNQLLCLNLTSPSLLSQP